jgi:beta-aspartyl-peptidase (threonine type)
MGCMIFAPIIPMDRKVAIAIHGGAGAVEKKCMTQDLHYHYEKCLKKALYAGLVILQNGGSSLDAVQAAVVELEDCPDFNAGRGAAFNRDGLHELDAAIMEGTTLRAGAVAGVCGVKNPVLLARAVLDKGDYVLLCGDNALRFAEEQQIHMEDNEYFSTPERRAQWRQAREKGVMTAAQKHGTVGAVALDSLGHLASATSTGGLMDKAYGRVSDSCIVGGGIYANDSICAISCTGDGECFIRSVAAYDIACIMQYQGLGLKAACERVLNEKIRPMGGSGGMIAIDRYGHIEMPFITEGMYRACFHTDGSIQCSIY